jgi:hypothetical protein
MSSGAPRRGHPSVEVGIGMVVHPRAEIDKPLWNFDSCGQNIGGQRIDCEDVRETVPGDHVALAITDRGIVNHRVEATETRKRARESRGAVRTALR